MYASHLHQSIFGEILNMDVIISEERGKQAGFNGIKINWLKWPIISTKIKVEYARAYVLVGDSMECGRKAIQKDPSKKSSSSW